MSLERLYDGNRAGGERLRHGAVLRWMWECGRVVENERLYDG